MCALSRLWQQCRGERAGSPAGTAGPRCSAHSGGGAERLRWPRGAPAGQWRRSPREWPAWEQGANPGMCSGLWAGSCQHLSVAGPVTAPGHGSRARASGPSLSGREPQTHGAGAQDPQVDGGGAPVAEAWGCLGAQHGQVSRRASGSGRRGEPTALLTSASPHPHGSGIGT